MEFKSCFENQEKLKEIFSSRHTVEEKYTKVIELGRSLKPYPKEDQTPDRLVKGCQSQLYLKSTFNEGKMHFLATSDALISAGLAALLLMIYDGEPPEALLKCPPTALKHLEITSYLSPSRANGLRSLFLKMQQDAITALHKSDMDHHASNTKN
ncbi:SufE family protein [Simkania negevensis]|uniref:Cysteine desulfuration protein sufE n=1 Tax=Simkania negevensis (strain ATCC VR-1471 / DSM 27360 / Z) TaxID=331113 RepID=F8L984_SIMNZ|nr:SufE family protein [Simkania negevensis]MCB1074187.1 SufE family protein [Simkania sp.]CCB89399.1 cysteine desulfuration protein sufE [Simkania negevensis Z]